MPTLLVAADDQHSIEALEEVGRSVLEAREVPRPPKRDWQPGECYPLAFDAAGEHAAIALAWMDPYPDVAPGWWNRVIQFQRRSNGWAYAGGEHDSITSPTPFDRPGSAPKGCWVDWHTNGPAGVWSDEPTIRTSFTGVAPGPIERLVVAGSDGAERDLTITPWCGAYVGVVIGAMWTLRGYDADGPVGSINDDRAEAAAEALKEK